MQERVEFCYKMLSEPPEWLHGIVFLDESSVALSPKPQRVICRRGKEALVTDPRTRKDKRQIQYLHYMLSVCWATCLVKLDILSFTKGYVDPVQYYVSGCCPPPAAARQPPPSWSACSLAHLHARFLHFLSIAGSVQYELHLGLLGGQVDCLVQERRPELAVLEVQAQQAPTRLECRRIFAPVCILLLLC